MCFFFAVNKTYKVYQVLSGYSQEYIDLTRRAESESLWLLVFPCNDRFLDEVITFSWPVVLFFQEVVLHSV